LTATSLGVRISMLPPLGGIANSGLLVKHCGQADPHKQHLRAAG